MAIDPRAIQSQAYGRYNRVIAYNGGVRAGFFNTPISDSENLDTGLLAGEPGSYSFEEFPTAEGQFAQIDWRGTINESKVVLRWFGPNGRYRQIGDNPVFTSREVFQNGRILAKAPDFVVAASVTTAFNDPTWGSIPLLNVVTRSFAKFRVLRKPFGIFSDDIAMYDPVDAPNGWKELALIDPPPDADLARWGVLHEVMFFNASGTECRAMIQVETPLNGFVPFPDSRYAEFRIQLFSDTAIGSEVGLNGGAIISKIRTTQCTSARTQAFFARSSQFSFSDQLLWSATYPDGNKFWVDFKGDTPVYATWEKMGTRRVGSSSSESTCPDMGNWSSSVESSDDDWGTFFFDPFTVLTVSGIEFTQGRHRTNDRSQSNNGGNPPPCDASSFQRVVTETWFDAVLYADMRYDVVVGLPRSQVLEDITTFDFSSGGAPVTTEIVTDRDFARLEAMKIWAGGQVHTLYENVDQENRQIILEAELNACVVCAFCCEPPAPYPSSCSENENLPEPDAAEWVVGTYWGAFLDLPGGQNIDVSFDGDIVFFSERPLREWFFFLPETPEEFTNFLTDGDPVAITGLTGDNPRFAGINLMR